VFLCVGPGSFMGGGLTLETLCVIMRSLNSQDPEAFISIYHTYKTQDPEAFISIYHTYKTQDLKVLEGIIRPYSQQYSQLILNNYSLIENGINNNYMFFNIFF
jgi:hypothetical protein